MSHNTVYNDEIYPHFIVVNSKNTAEITFLQARVTDKFILFISLIIYKYLVPYCRSVLSQNFIVVFMSLLFKRFCCDNQAPAVAAEVLAFFKLNQHLNSPQHFY